MHNQLCTISRTRSVARNQPAEISRSISIRLADLQRPARRASRFVRDHHLVITGLRGPPDPLLGRVRTEELAVDEPAQARGALALRRERHGLAIARELVEPESLAEYERLQRALRDGERTEVRYAVRHAELGRRWLLTRVEPGDGESGRRTVVTVDVTEQESAQRQSQQLLREHGAVAGAERTREQDARRHLRLPGLVPWSLRGQYV